MWLLMYLKNLKIYLIYFSIMMLLAQGCNSYNKMVGEMKGVSQSPASENNIKANSISEEYNSHLKLLWELFEEWDRAVMRSKVEKKYHIYGEIVDGSDYPTAIFVYGVAYREDVHNEKYKGYDNCIRYNASNIAILSPDESKTGQLVYNRGLHCCLDIVTYRSNVIGAAVPVYWYGKCKNEIEEEEMESKLKKQLYSLFSYCINLGDAYFALYESFNKNNDKMNTAYKFLEALKNANGDEAIKYVIPKKRNRGAYKAQEINKYYSSLEIPIMLMGISYDHNDGNIVAAFFSKEYGKPVRIILEKMYLEKHGEKWLIQKIIHLVRVDVLSMGLSERQETTREERHARIEANGGKECITLCGVRAIETVCGKHSQLKRLSTQCIEINGDIFRKIFDDCVDTECSIYE